VLIWRLSARAYARVFNGGYGLANSGRWNSVGHPVTYGATVPSLAVLEKLVHVQDPTLLPPLEMVLYEAPETLSIEVVEPASLPRDWTVQQSTTQSVGDAWLTGLLSPLLQVPSVIVHPDDSTDRNIVINHRHPDSERISFVRTEPFSFDPRLL
jgi:RES domain-containing protein